MHLKCKPKLTWTLQADCDDVDALKAILSGLKARHEKTGDLPLLIHTVSLLPRLLMLNFGGPLTLPSSP